MGKIQLAISYMITFVIFPTCVSVISSSSKIKNKNVKDVFIWSFILHGFVHINGARCHFFFNLKFLIVYILSFWALQRSFIMSGIGTYNYIAN